MLGPEETRRATIPFEAGTEIECIKVLYEGSLVTCA